MVTKEEYVLHRVKHCLNHHVDKNKNLKLESLQWLIEQWEFDYEMEKSHRPEVLRKL